MSNQVLALKWRPRTFKHLVGQQHILQTLINILDNQRLHHAYLFTGTRGVGKTTIARILAKCLNCEAGVSSTPCGECAHCQAIDEGRFIDLLEIDAASRTKVEDTRELLENVQYAPTRGRFKVYLIDEVHMLSGHSFNALLKTLEEPPQHVKFLLATTEPQKLPVTVLSRCLQFHLKNMSPEQIVEHLTHVLKNEDIHAEEPALWQLSQAADGSMRDALSLLDQAIAYTDSHITEAAIRDMLGTVEHTHIIALLKALVEREPSTLMNCCKQLAQQGANFHFVLNDLLTFLHQIAITQIVPEAVDNNFIDKETTIQLAKSLTREDVQLFYQIALHGLRDLPIVPNPQRGFEMIVLRMLAFQPATTKSFSTPPVVPSSENITKKTTSTTNTNIPDTSHARSQAQETQTPITQPKSQQDISLKPEQWSTIVNTLKLSGMSLALANHCVIHTVNGRQIELQLDPAHAPLLSEKSQRNLTEALCDHFGKTVKVIINIEHTDTPTPAMITNTENKEKQRAAQQAIEADSNVQAIMEQFDAKIIPNSVKKIQH